MGQQKQGSKVPTPFIVVPLKNPIKKSGVGH
jgi:hypothetical protein